MKQTFHLFFALFLVVSFAFQSDAQELSTWANGETWRYQHEGPVPFRGEDSTVDGDRVLTVLKVSGLGPDARWTLKDIWGDLDDAPRTLTIDADRKVHAMQWGDDGITYDPPMKLDYTSLKVGEETTQTVNVRFGDGGMKTTITAKREADEDVTVPAGAFKGCIFVKTVMTLQLGEMKMPVDHHLWYHPKANYLVKEKYVFNPISVGDQKWGGYSCVSELKEHKKP